MWYNSAFYHEDKDRIKDIHELLSKRHTPINSQQDPARNPVNPTDSEGEPRSTVPAVETCPTIPTVNEGESCSNDQAVDTRPTFAEAVSWGLKLNVCLITDSIMRHVTEGDLGDKYAFRRIDLRDTGGLNSEKVRHTLNRLQPHFVYVHLGINDIQNQTRQVDQSIANIDSFLEFMTDTLPETKVGKGDELPIIPAFNRRQWARKSPGARKIFL